MDEYIVGLDIGSSKICGAAGKIDTQGKLQIAGVKSVSCSGLKKGIVVDIDSTSEAIKNCVEQLIRMIDKEITSVYISLPGGICELIPSQGVVAISSEDREIKKSDIKRVLNAAKVMSVPSNKEIIGVIPNEYIIDGYDNIKDPIGMSGLKLEVDAHIILAQSTIVSNLLKSVTNAGLKVNGISLEPMAAAKSSLIKDEFKMGAALIDIGAEKIDISLYKGSNILFTEMIPFGGNTITNDIALCLKVPFTEAEKLKVKNGSLIKAADLSASSIKVNAGYNETINVNYSTLIEVIEARVEEYFILIRNTLERKGYLNDIASIVLIGGGVSYFNGVCELARDILGVPVRIGVPEYLGASSPVYNTAVGIVKDAVNAVEHTQPVRKIKETKNYTDDREDEKYMKNENTSVLSKIKGFLADFF